MATEKYIQDLVVNKFDSLDTYKALKDRLGVDDINIVDPETLGANIPVQDTPPTEGDLWIDTSEEGELITPASIGAYTIAETDAAIQSAIETIPTPDVSGQIFAHNTDIAAHTDIRAAMPKITIREW